MSSRLSEMFCIYCTPRHGTATGPRPHRIVAVYVGFLFCVFFTFINSFLEREWWGLWHYNGPKPTNTNTITAPVARASGRYRKLINRTACQTGSTGLAVGTFLFFLLHSKFLCRSSTHWNWIRKWCQIDNTCRMQCCKISTSRHAMQVRELSVLLVIFVIDEVRIIFVNIRLKSVTDNDKLQPY